MNQINASPSPRRTSRVFNVLRRCLPGASGRRQARVANAPVQGPSPARSWDAYDVYYMALGPRR